jgi:alpha-ketoglutarate-dependent taurine dioxygenase
MQSDIQAPPEAGFQVPDVSTWHLDGPSSILFIEPKAGALANWTDALAWVRDHRGALDQMLHQAGGLVLRGFPVRGAENFGMLIDLLGPYAGDYAGGASARSKITGNVMEATRLSEEIKIPLHQEMAYLTKYPAHIVFYCHTAAPVGGETIVGDMRAVTQRLPSGIREKLERHGVMAVRNFAPPPAPGEQEDIADHPDLRSWQFAFYTDDKAVVEEACREKGMEPIWNADGTLTVRTLMDAFTTHPQTGERLYRNVIHVDPASGFSDALPADRRAKVMKVVERQAMPTGYYLGDGSALAGDDRAALQAVFADIETKWQWQSGDIMLLDNLLTAHGRNPFSGPREVQVGLLN